MKRLTNHFDYCDFISCKHRNPELAKANQCDFFNMTSMDKCHDKAIYEKLREYEDLEEQGLLLKLPCKFGARVYAILELIDFETGQCFKTVRKTCFEAYMADQLGKTVFLTTSEAEKALAEMGCE